MDESLTLLPLEIAVHNPDPSGSVVGLPDPHLKVYLFMDLESFYRVPLL